MEKMKCLEAFRRCRLSKWVISEFQTVCSNVRLNACIYSYNVSEKVQQMETVVK